MKKKLLYITALILTGITNSAFVYGQSSFRLDQLQGKTWRYQWPAGKEDDDYSELTFTCCIETNREYMPGEEDIILSNPFYLSDTFERRFDDNKIGQNQSGKYLVVKGDGDPEEDDEYNLMSYSIYEALKFDNAEFTMINYPSGIVSTFRVVNVFTMKYVIDNTPTSTLVGNFHPTKTSGFLEGYNYPVNSTAIPDRLHTNVQLTSPTDNRSAARGKFFRKYAIGSYYLVIVTFGDATNNRTDVLCIVDRNGNIRSTLEGWVTVNGMTVKSYGIQPDGDVYIDRIAPSSSTPLLFESLPSFSGKVERTVYSTSGSFVYKSAYPPSASTSTFTKSFLSDIDRVNR